MRYDPYDWYWNVNNDLTKVWSSKHVSYVDLNNAEYVSWIASGGQDTKIISEQELNDVLAAHFIRGPIAAAASSPKVAALDFISRFTDTEQMVVASAALQSPALLLWFLKAVSAQDIHLDDPRTIAGMAALVTANLITESRKNVILTP